MSQPKERSFMQEIFLELHNLCQPLTALQCRLEIAKATGELEALRSGVEDSLVETSRMFEAVAQMRKCLLAQQAAMQ
jgi:hypothetical protein